MPTGAVEVVAGVVAVLGDEPPAVAGRGVERRSCSAGDVVIVVELTEPGRGVRTVDPPSVEFEWSLEPVGEHRRVPGVEPISQACGAMVELRQRGDAVPCHVAVGLGVVEEVIASLGGVLIG